MSEQPMVACVMLTRDRPEMAKRAVECFRQQTYKNKMLLIWDSADGVTLHEGGDRYKGGEGIVHVCLPSRDSIGKLRNTANSWAGADILCHWDDDDVSHPNRLAEQVTLLQASGADCVGYSDMLFWRDCRNPPFPSDPSTCQVDPCFCLDSERGQAWLYLGPQKALGTSLCYWRRTWERKPFPDQPRPGHANGEDTDWIKGLELRAVPSTGSLDSLYVHFVEVPNLDGVRQYEPGKMTVSGDPRMIASIHGANTSGSYKLIADSTSWRRVPEWDEYCRKAMAL